MKGLIWRGLTCYFRDKANVFFSMLGVIIIFCLFVFFLGDTISFGENLAREKEMINYWMVSGMLASSAMTTSVGAYTLMVSDREHKQGKDFMSSPIERWKITGGYWIPGVLIGIIMSLFTLVAGVIYVLAKGGEFPAFEILLKCLGVILLNTLASSAIVCFLIRFIKTSSAFTAFSVLVGTLIGFLVGAYIPVGQLPDGVQMVVKCFPCAHAAALFRTLLMKDSMQEGFAGASSEVVSDFSEQLGITFNFGDTVFPFWGHILVLIGTSILFYLLSTIIFRKKSQ
ncbi:MAG: ABC transporter permease [Ruminococcus sp.]|nr:ABC transporter permease [Ruminococcus sp.]